MSSSESLPPSKGTHFGFQGLENSEPRSLMDFRSGYFVRISSTVNAL